jgi:cyclic pyranopterin phosphate synthase
MPKEGVAWVRRDEVLSWEEMFSLCSVLADCGVRKIRVTGGEPFVRSGLLPFLSKLRLLPGHPEIALTTNATLLEENLDRLLDAGIDRLNISLDTLRPDRFRALAGQDLFEDAWRGVEAAFSRGLAVKLNVVVLAGFNEDEIGDFVRLTRDRDITARFIEAMSFADRGGKAEDVVDGDTILDHIRETAPVERLVHDRAAVEELYRAPGFAGRVGVIRGHTRTFCGNCSRLRINAVGQLRTCLYARPSLDLRAPLRSGAAPEEIRRLIGRAVLGRHADGWAAQASREGKECRLMSRIGG